MRNSKKSQTKVLAAVVLGLLVLLSAANFHVVMEPLSKLTEGEITFEGFVSEVQGGYSASSFVPKNNFVNLNGLFARLTGRRVLNNVVRGEKGMLTQKQDSADIGKIGKNIVDFSEYLDECENIPFLYVQLPYKEDLDGELFPEGIESYANANADALLSVLRDAGVRCMDMRPQLSQTTEQLEQYFYRTDHHWNPEGAFVAFQEIAAELNIMFPEDNVDLKYTREEQWERHELNNWFLGSRGKRVGEYFGGTDSLVWLTPRFETEMSCSIPKHGELYKGDFTAANIRSQYIEKTDYFGYNAYCVYIGGDYPLVQHRNLSAPSALRVLLIKDSFTLPLQSYMSTIFQEVDVVDPRHFSECTIAEYAAWTRPDVVILEVNPSQVSSRAYQDFGINQVCQAQGQKGEFKVVEQRDIQVMERDNNWNYAVIPIEQDSLYRVSFDDVTVLAGETEGVGLRVYNSAAKAVIDNIIFDISYCKTENEFIWTFQTPKTDDDIQLLLYAGIYSHTAGNSVTYHSLQLEKWCGT